MTGPRERGSVTIFAMAVVGLAAVLMLGVARVGGAATTRARADRAAEAAALAAADALALGYGGAQARAAAAETARANDARLQSCECDALAAEVTVLIDPGGVIGRARAEVDLAALYVSGVSAR
jgi:secretion/DNA translocation related TadE-like protein